MQASFFSARIVLIELEYKIHIVLIYFKGRKKLFSFIFFLLLPLTFLERFQFEIKPCKRLFFCFSFIGNLFHKTLHSSSSIVSANFPKFFCWMVLYSSAHFCNTTTSNKARIFFKVLISLSKKFFLWLSSWGLLWIWLPIFSFHFLLFY